MELLSTKCYKEVTQLNQNKKQSKQKLGRRAEEAPKRTRRQPMDT